jgi:hypothetical protein
VALWKQILTAVFTVGLAASLLEVNASSPGWLPGRLGVTMLTVLFVAAPPRTRLCGEI